MNKHDMRQHLPQLGNGAHALAIQILGNTDDATDAVHDAFVKVLGKPEAYNPNTGSLAPWFLRVVRNQCIDMIRRRKPGDIDVETLRYEGPSPEACLETAQRDQGLQLALAKLSAGQRQIIILRDYMDLGYAAIADVLDIPQGTVMSKLHRARLALKKELSRHD